MAMLVPLQLPGVHQLLFRLIGANMNVTTDQPFGLIGPAVPGRYVIERVLCLNASISLTTAAGGIYTAASKGGNALVAATQAYAALTGPTLGLELTVAAVGRGMQSVTPILSLTTAQGAAATADYYLFGSILVNL